MAARSRRRFEPSKLLLGVLLAMLVYMPTLVSALMSAPAPLTISCPPPVVTSAGIVVYAAPTVTGGAAPVTVSQISGLATGSNFVVTTINTFKATDFVGRSETCPFTVTIP